MFLALLFDLSSSPRVFNRVAGVTVVFLHTRGVTVFSYLNHRLIAGDSRSQTERDVQFTLSCLERLGWIRQHRKSDLVPSQCVLFLEALLDFKRGVAVATDALSFS